MDDSASFLAEIQEEFLEESQGFLEQTEQHFLDLESNPSELSILEHILRLAHNLKGSAAAVGFEDFSHFAHQFEDLLVMIKQGEIQATPGVIDILLQSNDMLKNFIEELNQDKAAHIDTSAIVKEITTIMESQSAEENVAQIDSIEEKAKEKEVETGAEAKQAETATASDPWDALEVEKNAEATTDEQPVAASQDETQESSGYQNIGTILIEDNLVSEADVEKAAEIQQEQKIGEVLVEQGKLEQKQLDQALEKQEAINEAVSKDKAPAAAAAAAAAPPAGTPPAAKKPEPKKADEFIRLPLKKIEDLLNCFSEQVILQSALDHYKEDIAGNIEGISRTILSLSKITHELQQTAISLRMLSLRNLFNKMQRTVRDTSKILNKEIKFIIQGEDTELDKTMIDELNSPITHLVRNSCDHGIESTEDRIKAGKSKHGTIVMKASYSGRYFYLEISDDGKGLDVKRIREKGIEKGLINANQQLGEKDILNLIFQAGFSTHDVATDISGRGVGMDAIRTAIEKLRGTIDIQSTAGQGTKIMIKLPPSLAIFQGIVVRIGERKFIVASSEIYEIYQIHLNNTRELRPGEDIIRIRDSVVPLIDVKKVFKMKQEPDRKTSIMLQIHYNNKSYGILVNDIMVQQRIVFKNLGEEIEGLPGVAGGTILADGQVALILEMNDIVNLHLAGLT